MPAPGEAAAALARAAPWLVHAVDAALLVAVVAFWAWALRRLSRRGEG